MCLSDDQRKILETDEQLSYNGAGFDGDDCNAACNGRSDRGGTET